jgi:ubiquitin carboxyl-terminal hydrolase 1
MFNLMESLYLTTSICDSSSMFSMSKVHDYMPAPMELECFCESCPAESPNPEHTYQLYAVIMHLGITMASGHYVAFVRADSSQQQGYFDCNIHQAAQAAAAGAAPAPPTGGILKFLKKTERPSVCSLGANACPSTDCCGVKVLMPDEREQEGEPLWLECDDDHVRLLAENEFVELLAPAKSKTLSPYILFYSRKSQAR